MKFALLALKLFGRNIKQYLTVFILLVVCTVLINANLSELFAKTRYTDDIRHFSDQGAYILSQFLSVGDGMPSLSDYELSSVKGIERVISCNCGRTSLSGLSGITTEKQKDDIYVAYTTNGFTDEVKIDLAAGRLPAERDDGVYEILVSESLSDVLSLNSEYVFREADNQYKALVVGVLARGGTFLALTGEGNASSYFREITADPGWIIIPKEHSYIKSFLKIVFFEKSLSDAEKESLITELNTEYGYLYGFDSLYKELSESVRRDILEKLPLCALLLIICFISVSGCVSLNTVNELKTYGIFRIHGATKENCFTVAFLSNLAVIVSALVISGPVFSLYGKIAFRQPPYISWRNYVITLIIFIGVLLISSVIPRVLLNKSVFNLYNEA